MSIHPPWSGVLACCYLYKGVTGWWNGLDLYVSQQALCRWSCCRGQGLRGAQGCQLQWLILQASQAREASRLASSHPFLQSPLRSGTPTALLPQSHNVQSAPSGHTANGIALHGPIGSGFRSLDLPSPPSQQQGQCQEPVGLGGQELPRPLWSGFPQSMPLPERPSTYATAELPQLPQVPHTLEVSTLTGLIAGLAGARGGFGYEAGGQAAHMPMPRLYPAPVLNGLDQPCSQPSKPADLQVWHLQSLFQEVREVVPTSTAT